MVNYAVTTYDIRGSVQDVLAALETKLETVDNGKTIRLLGIVPEGYGFHGFIIYDT